MKNTFFLVLVAIFIFSFAWVITEGIDRQEIGECNQFLTESQEYSGFYITHWQAEQCRYHNITINAPIK